MAKNPPFTVRLDPGLETRIEALARRSRRSKGAVLEELASEAERSRRYPGIGFRGPDWSRRSWVLGTGLDVWELIQAFQDLGGDGEAILATSDLDRRQLEIALAYYREFPGEIDEAIAANRRSIEELSQEYPFAQVLTVAE